MDADRGQFQIAMKRPAIERFDVDQLVLETEIAGIQFVLGQRKKHESIVGIGAVADSNQRFGLLGHEFLSPLTGRVESKSTPQGSRQRAGYTLSLTQ
jgi:hypothetical protein